MEMRWLESSMMESSHFCENIWLVASANWFMIWFHKGSLKKTRQIYDPLFSWTIISFSSSMPVCKLKMIFTYSLDMLLYQVCTCLAMQGMHQVCRRAVCTGLSFSDTTVAIWQPAPIKCNYFALLTKSKIVAEKTLLRRWLSSLRAVWPLVRVGQLFQVEEEQNCGLEKCVTQRTHLIVWLSRHLAELLNHLPVTGDYHLHKYTTRHEVNKGKYKYKDKDKDKDNDNDDDNDKDRHARLSPHNTSLYKINTMSHTSNTLTDIRTLLYPKPKPNLWPFSVENLDQIQDQTLNHLFGQSTVLSIKSMNHFSVMNR